MSRRFRTRDVWIVGLIVLVAATALLYSMRSSLQQAHVVLLYSLIVLAASAYGGRTIGFVFAVLSVLSIDYYFEAPFDEFSVASSVDWFVLAVFFLTTALAASLLAQAQAAAERASNRTQEVIRLSRLGAELLGVGTAQHAVLAIADKVRDATNADRCAVFRLRDPASLELLVVLESGSSDIPGATTRAMRALTANRIIVKPVRGEAREVAASASLAVQGSDAATQWIAIPLHAHDRTIGALTVFANGSLRTDEGSMRLLDALTYYAAIAVERVTLVAQLEQAEAARESARVREALLTSVSHDLRTPLTTIKLLAQELTARRDHDVAIANGRVIEEQAERMNSMVGNLLDMTRLRSAAFPMRVEVNAADDLIGAVARQVSGILGDHPLQRSLDEDGPVMLGRFDFVQTQRILVNLIENAARYAPPGTTIDLAAWRDGAQLKLSVSDRGPGIAPNERDRIFEPFYRGHSASADSGGVGLGLYVSRALAEAQGATLDLTESRVGKTAFVLSLEGVDATGDASADIDLDVPGH